MPGSDLRQPLSDGEAVAVGLERAGKVALRHLHVADLAVRHRQIALPAGVAGIGLSPAGRDGEAVAVGLERAGKVALRHLHVADLVVRHRQIALVVGALRIAGKQVRQDLPGLLGGGERARRVADRQQRIWQFPSRAAASLRLRSGVTCPDLMSCSCSARARSRMSLTSAAGIPTRIAEPLRQVEHQAVGGLGRGGERVFGALTLLLGDLPLLVRYPLLFDGNARAANKPARQARARRRGRLQGSR